MPDPQVSAELVAVVVSVTDDRPRVLLSPDAAPATTPPRAARDLAGLPSGPLRSEQSSLQRGLREWVRTQTGLTLGYIEQLYTFADPDRLGSSDWVMSVSYLGLTRPRPEADWHDWYAFFPWEDRRAGDDRPVRALQDAMQRWAAATEAPASRASRCEVSWALHGRPWLPELTLQRYELLYEAGLIEESPHSPDHASSGLRGEAAITGRALRHDHRRILATGIARLRSKIQYRPVVFELLPATFTLGQLQSVVEALAGQGVHKQNFRRLVTAQQLVEETGDTDAATGGRPARLYRFRPEVKAERAAAGTKVPLTRSR